MRGPDPGQQRPRTPLPGPNSRPPCVRGHRNMTVYSATRRHTPGQSKRPFRSPARVPCRLSARPVLTRVRNTSWTRSCGPGCGRSGSWRTPARCPHSSCTDDMSAMCEELHHLVDQLPEAEVRPVLELIRGRADADREIGKFFRLDDPFATLLAGHGGHASAAAG